LLAASSFGSLGQKSQFIFSKNKFESFLEKHKLQGMYELVQRKPKGFVNQHWFIKVSTQSWNHAAIPGGTKGVGPQIKNFR
jgi:hypothetical protein